jgi:hypothetical protein
MTAAWDNEELVVALRQAVLARLAVPDEFVQAGKDAFAWHNIDAELAQLTYDSTRELDQALSLRAETASIRALTFTSAHLTIELEVTQDALVGQVVPAQAATIIVQSQPGSEAPVSADEIGCFSIQPIPSGPFRLQCRTATGLEVLTGWTTL